MSELIDGLLEKLAAVGEEGDEAAMALGLLIERERVRRPPGQDGGVRLILGDAYADHRLTEQELESVIDRLGRYVDSTSRPRSTAVWALGKSYDERVVPLLVRLVDRLLVRVGDVDMDESCYQALTALANIHTDQSIRTLARAAERGGGKSQDFARSYIELFGHLH